MGEKDDMTNEYVGQNERFADLCNYVLFDGEPIIQADALERRDVLELAGVFGVDEKQIHYQRKWRDLLKHVVIKYTGEAFIVLLGVENQTNVHYAMPVRNMLYDALNYSAQVKDADKKHRVAKEHKSDAEFLSGFHKDDRLTPVITITLYWGNDAWDAPRTLHEMFLEVDEQLKCFLPDYVMNLVVPSEILDFEKFHTELGDVLAAIKASGNESSMAQFLEENSHFSKLDNESIRIINKFINTDIPMNQEEGVTDVCKAWDDHLERGRREGRAEGRTEGRTEGKREVLVSLVNDGLLALSEAAKRAGLSDKDFEKLLGASNI